MEGKSGLTGRFRDFKNLDVKDRRQWLKEFLINNSLYIFLLAAIVAIEIYNPVFLSIPSIVNIISLSAANLPIALGIAGCIILTGTDLSAGRIVGLVAWRVRLAAAGQRLPEQDVPWP